MGIGALVGAFALGGVVGFVFGTMFGKRVKGDFQKAIEEIRQGIMDISKRL